VLTKGKQIRAKPGFIPLHHRAQLKQKCNQKRSLATVVTPLLWSFDDTEFPPLTSEQQQKVIARTRLKAADRQAVTLLGVAVASQMAVSGPVVFLL